VRNVTSQDPTPWLEALEARHLADLRVPEVTRALRALSTDYVQRRYRVREAALDGRGKRAAFALFYGPLHFLAVDHICRALGAHEARAATLVDVGCGTGAAGSAWALALPRPPRVIGFDRHPWAVTEAAWTYRFFRLPYRASRGDAARPPAAVRAAGAGTALLLAYTVNELDPEERAALLPHLIAAAGRGAAILLVEPIARALTPWWAEWEAALAAGRGRADEWRISQPLPAAVRRLDLAAGLDHREQTARSLWVPPR
jgi:hypothetical protein